MVNNMKKVKYILIIISILTLAISLSACDKEEVLSQELEKEILKEFQKSYEPTYSIEEPELYIAEYYGNYNGAHIFFINANNVLYSFPKITKITIETTVEGEFSGYMTFEKKYIRLFGYYDGLIYTIDKLHSAGFITTEEVIDIWNRYCEKEYEIKLQGSTDLDWVL